ncbi:MAG TPA: carotenoid biosynthesis protein [Candidatus Saccharimonadales bacterium]|nr:carotenoid biosynthesis protein [Candidatus Saccharimonadales bacterium]
MTKAKVLWLLFGLQIVLTLCGIAGLGKGAVFDLAVTYLPLALLVLHACWVLTVRRGLAFILLAAFVGWAAEAISLHYGTLFGGEYRYPTQAGLFGVPFAIIAYWAIFIYSGYWLVTTFRYWLGKKKPDYKQSSLALVFLLVLADGLAVTAIDLFMDPISVRGGSWSWTHGGAYFGVPVGNFVGWFFVAVAATSVFRLFEYYWPQPAEPHIGRSALLVPVIGYLLVGLDFFAGALGFGLLPLAAIGTAIVIVPAAVNVALYVRSKSAAVHKHQ